MRHQVSVTTRLAATLLLVGIAAVGCAGHGGTCTDQSAGAGQAQTSQVDQMSPTPSASPSDGAMDSATPSDSAAGQGANPAATPDPLDSQLSGLDNLLNGINSSISSSDPGSAGGE